MSGVKAGLADKLAKPCREIGYRKKPVSAEQLSVLSIECLQFIQSVWSDLAHAGQSILRKLQAVWIDIARLHETACLLRASAWVCLVYQTTFVVHELIEIASGAGEELTKILW